jgi:hypothetical protein
MINNSCNSANKIWLAGDWLILKLDRRINLQNYFIRIKEWVILHARFCFKMSL